jgi:hypothetical protein
MQYLADLIRQSLRLPVFLPLLALTLVATWYGLGPSRAHFAELTGGGRFVDMQPELTAASLVAQAQGYAPRAVRYYLLWSAFDFAWPLLSFTTVMFITAWLFRFLPPERQGLFTGVVALGYAAVLMDWGENLAFVGVVLTADREPLGLARLAVVFHLAKLTFMTLFNVACLAALMAVVARRIGWRRAA